MIEKLKNIPIDMNGEPSAVWLKINELVDAVNELQHDNSEKANCQGSVQDDYAQYRDWAGKLCRFWNIDKDKAIYGILEEVKADWAYRFQMKGEKYLFDHCEPVKPTDLIIYKGGDDE